MNKNELVDAVAGRVGDRSTALAAVDAVLATVVGTVLSGERVALSGFGVFEKVERAARTARNPATGAPVDLPATSVPRFRPGQAFKDVISGAREAPAQPSGVAPRTPRPPRRAAPANGVKAVTEQPPAAVTAAPVKAVKAAKAVKAVPKVEKVEKVEKKAKAKSKPDKGKSGKKPGKK